MAYDLRHNLTRRTDHYGNATTLDYDANNNLLRERDPLGNEISHVYSRIGPGGAVFPGPTSTIDARGHVFSAEYDERGYLTAAIGPRGGRTEHAYDDLGRRISTIDPEGYRLVLETGHHQGHKTCSVFDDGGRLLKETAFCETCYGGTNDGNACSSHVDCPGGSCGLTATMTYDAQGNLLTRVGPDGATTSTEYTPTGQVARKADALGHSVQYEYDAEDRLAAVLANNPAERVYGTACPVVTAHVHDDGDRITEARVYVPDDAECSLESAALASAYATYDEIGNRTSLTDPNGHDTTYEYDLLQRLTRETDGLGAVAFTYDARDLITSRTTGEGDEIRYTYDDAGRFTHVDFSGDGIGHEYDANGNRVSSRRMSAAGPITRTFDPLDRMVSRTDEFGYTVAYEYDLAGNLTRLVYPSGAAVDYEYDGLNRLTRVIDWNGGVTNYGYDAAGNLVGVGLPDGSTVSYTYDAAHRLTGIDDSRSAQTHFRASYTLNAAGKRIAADLDLPLEPDPGAGRNDFAYGAANTLTDRTGAAGAASYVYDADGNMLSGTLGGSSRTMSYNALGQMETLDADLYRYDADGLRVEIARGGLVRRHVYDVTAAHARLLEERDDQGNLVARYVYGLGLISRDGPEGPRIYHYDGRGSTVALTDDLGTVTDRYAYGPYGQLLGSESETENPFTYAGRDGVQDDGNGLYYMRTRYYAPELGRFIQKDQVFDGTLSAPQSLNRYAYVQGDPILLTDPNGDFLFSFIVGIVVSAVIASTINIAVECADDDGCDAGDVFETLGTSILESIPGVGTIYQGISMGLSGEWDWASFGVSVASDALTVIGLRSSVTAGKAGLKLANEALESGVKYLDDFGKLSTTLQKGISGAYKTYQKTERAWEFVSGVIDVIDPLVANREAFRDRPDASPPDPDGTGADELNPKAIPKPGKQSTTQSSGCKGEVWR
jgi:RHS repeat-associated protein